MDSWELFELFLRTLKSSPKQDALRGAARNPVWQALLARHRTRAKSPAESKTKRIETQQRGKGMKHVKVSIRLLWALWLSALKAQAQQVSPLPSAETAAVPHLVKFGGRVKDPNRKPPTGYRRHHRRSR